MYELNYSFSMKILAIIPARGGSKSIPKKNIYKINGKPLIAYTIETAKKTTLINRVIVSTDSEEIAVIARRYGAETPFIRPSKFAKDNTPDLPVFLHALDWLRKNESYEPDIIVHLWPTSPFRIPLDIDNAIKLLIKNKTADSVRSVTEPSQTPFKMWRLGKNMRLYPILEKEFPKFYKKNHQPYTMPRQRLPKTWVQTGYVSILWRKTIQQKKSMCGDNIIPFFHDQSVYTELDSYKDLFHTKYILSKFKKSGQ